MTDKGHYEKIADDLSREIGFHGANLYQLAALQTFREIVSNLEIRADERRIMCDEKDATIKRLHERIAELETWGDPDPAEPEATK